MLSERMLMAWLKLSTVIINARVVSDMPYNQALICNVLSRGDKEVTATKLCRETRILKSQMNRILNEMEKEGIIERKRCDEDKRKIYIYLKNDNEEKYVKQHEKIIEIVENIVNMFDEKKAEEIIEVFESVSKAAQKYLAEEDI